MNALPSIYGISPALALVIAVTAAAFAVAATFLFAAARLRRANSRKAAMWARMEGQLSLTIETIAQGTVSPDALHSRIRPAERVVLLDYLYKAMMHEKRPSRKDLYAELARPYLPLLEERARTGDVWQRARAIRTIAELAGYEAQAVVLTGLDDPAPHVAMTAARVYAQLALGPVDTLLARIDRYQNWDRRLLRAVLVSFGPAAIGALHAKLADRTATPYVRAVCADALAALGFDGAADTAASVLSETKDIELLAATLRLMRARATPAQREVVRRLCSAENDVVRGQAVACLGRIGNASDRDLIEQVAADLSPWVARNAHLALASLGAAPPVAAHGSEGKE